MPKTEPSAPLAIVVDDDPAIRQFVGAVAELAGFTVAKAENGQELLGLLNDRSPALIILDLHMASIDGVAVMRELAARRITSKIVIFSGSDLRVLETSSEIARQRGLTITAVLQKPVRKEDLLQLLRRVILENEVFSAATLRECMSQKLIALHYQPKISLTSHQVIGVEALLRCSDPVGRPIGPEAVIAIAEDAEIVDELTEWVFREAVGQQRRWSEQGTNLGMAINLSARCSFNQDLPELFAGICAELEVPNDAVTIELTESAVMNDQLLAMESIVRLRLLGFRLSIDDFGIGYSSLLRLKSLPFTEMKVDKSFVTALHESRDNSVIVRAIVQLARSLEMESVVEGIEDQAAMDFATSLGCHAAQGYFIGRPVPGPEIGGFMKAWHWRQQAERLKDEADRSTNHEPNHGRAS